MGFVIQSIAFYIVVFVIMFFLGSLITRRMADSARTVSFSVAAGFVILFCVAQAAVVPFVFSQSSLTAVSVVFIAAVAALVVTACILNRKNFREYLGKLRIRWSIPLVVALGLIVFQIVMVTGQAHSDADDAYYVGVANTAVTTDTVYTYDPYTGEPFFTTITNALPYKLSSYNILCAVLSFITGIHPAAFMHTVLPAALILVSYLVFYLIGKELFQSERSVWIFLIFISLLNVFGNYSAYTAQTFLLFRIWHGKAIVANIVLPMMILLFLRIARGKDRFVDWLLLLLTTVAACAAAPSGMYASIVATAAFTVPLAIVKKKPAVLLKGIACATPAIAFLAVYLVVTKLLV